MLLLFDVGNSNISFAIYENEKFIHEFRIKTDINKMMDEYAIIINNLISKYTIDAVVIGSVVPIITYNLESYSNDYLNIKPLTIGPGVKTGLDIKLNNPKEIGADLVASAVGSIIKYPQPTIIIDMGTATTISLVDNNTFYGGAVMPGVETSLYGLVTKTALLPHIDIKAPKRVVERETVACMQSGVVYGTASMLDGMIERIEKEINKKCFVIATGGLSKYITPHCNHKITSDPNLIYDGLVEIYKKNLL
ncbi:MAG: coaX [Haloplasmataceae bacterium]|jgi:type III pantothenate kinase|nr:coaX [Haloplasmataceae bacterium]